MKIGTQKKLAAGLFAITGLGLFTNYALIPAFKAVASGADKERTVPVVKGPVVSKPVAIPQSPDSGAVLADLKERDLAQIAKNNKNGVTYTYREVLSTGSTCDKDGKTDGKGYQGPATSISYGVIKTDHSGTQFPVRICFNHDAAGNRAKGGTIQVGPALEKAAPADPRQERVEDQSTVIDRLKAADAAQIRKNNKSGVAYEPKKILSLGQHCLGNAKTDERGYNGLATSISYGVVKTDRSGNHIMRICFDHDRSGSITGGKTAVPKP